MKISANECFCIQDLPYAIGRYGVMDRFCTLLGIWKKTVIDLGRKMLPCLGPG